MPRSKTPKDKLDTPANNVTQGIYWLTADAPWGGFINVSLNEGDKAAFRDWDDAHRGEVASMLEDLMAEGMKYSAAYDRENECFIVTFTGALIEKSNLRCSVTTRAGNWRECDALAVWKHYVLCAGNYGDLLTTGRKRSWG